jgi:hypothetical protein
MGPRIAESFSAWAQRHPRALLAAVLALTLAIGMVWSLLGLASVAPPVVLYETF